MSDTPPESGEKTSLHINPNLESSLCYLFECISGLLFFLIERDNQRIRFHALQSILMFTVLGFLTVVSSGLAILTDFEPFRLANYLIWIIHFVIWVVMIVATFRGKTIKIPGIGDFAQEQVGWP
ncbi:hypothetical protein L0222_12215 [bacterium]|nr:hypothetical protein [bacterium]MCI0602369.1 hypothetical protein [bacterium]